MCETHEGYGRWGNAAHRAKMRKLNHDQRKEYVKKLWLEDSTKYFE